MSDDSRCWADLDQEILNLIRQRLLGDDYSNFRATCRSWNFRAVYDPAVYENLKYPFLLRFTKGGEEDDNNYSYSSCNAYSLAYDKSYYISAPPDLLDAKIMCSNHGWLLVAKGPRVFFYHPSIQHVIRLPNIKSHQAQFSFASFSAPPTSLDCMVLGVVDSKSRTKRDSLSSVEDNVLGSSTRFRMQPGAFYCLAQDGRLGVFDPTKEKKGNKKKMWRLLPHTTKKPRVFMDDDPRKDQAYLLECNGELISIVVAPMGEFVRIIRF
ncbi:unnamed protein product [Linum tenue]|uniref:KIB1-4 beta-propeller domain-containing protein n=1 Tax=Linum tenue TaxID=586396 RepID=A0AAV0HFB1_9ROSI|nr:unnamed protein product [Linum tenue]